MYGTSEDISSGAKDVSMVDVSSVNKSNQSKGEQEVAQSQRRKSTLLLNEDIDLDRMNIDEKNHHNDEDMNIDRSMSQNAMGNQAQSSGLAEFQHAQQTQLQSESHSHQQEAQSQPTDSAVDPNLTIPIEIKWVQGGEKVYVTGSFTGWRKMIGLSKQSDNNFSITLGLPIGTHRFRFVIDNELRFSDFLPTATDQMGNFVNYVEVTPEHIQSHLAEENKKSEEENRNAESDQSTQYPSRKSSVSRSATRTDSMWGLTNDDDDMGNGYSRYHDDVDADDNDNQRSLHYINDIPPIFTDPKVMEQYYVAIDKQAKSSNGQQQAWLHPPQLPPHLESVILNNFNSNDKDNNSGALPIPNHVVLNHLATTSIKHNTLAVASVVRYKRKYVTQILYAPLQQ